MVIFWEPTMVCNQHCIVCCFYGEHGHRRSGEGELSGGSLVEIVKRLAAAYKNYPWRPVVILSGGEPLLHPDIVILIRSLNQYGFRFAILTNLMDVPKKLLDQLLRANPAEIRISVDGTKQVHDMLRRTGGAFDGTIHCLRYLLERRNHRQTRITINCTLSRWNTEYLMDVFDIAKAEGIGLNVQHLNFLTNKLMDAHEEVCYRLFGEPLRPRSHVDSFTEKEGLCFERAVRMLDSASREAKVALSFLPSVPMHDISRYYADLDGYTFADSCSAPWSIARIDSLGNLYPCYEQIWGNLLRESLKTIWNGERARRFRRTIKIACLLPGCRRCPKLW
jgi:MoaA/NifB/PqqE/SkfB family radical SAM enzyme